MPATRVSLCAGALLCALGAPQVMAQKNQKPFFVRVLPDNAHVIAAGEEGSLVLLTLPELTVVRRFAGDAGQKIKSVAVSPDGKLLAAHYDKGQLWVFDVESGEAKYQIGDKNLKSGPTLFTPTGRLLVVGGSMLRQWDMATGQDVGEPLRIRGDRPTLSPEGRYLTAVGLGLDVHVYDVAENKDVMQIGVRGAPALDDFERDWRTEVAFLGFRSDGRVVLGLAYTFDDRGQGKNAPPKGMRQMEGRIVSFDPAHPLPLDVTQKEMIGTSGSRVLPDGRVIVVTTGSLSLWDVEHPEATTPWETVDPGKNRMLDDGDLSADGVWVVGCSKRSGEIEVWDTRVLEKREKKAFGATIASWTQPKLVTLAPMP